MSGHLQREFHHFYLRPEKKWDASWFSPKSLTLPPKVVEGFMSSIRDLARKYSVGVTDEELRNWICQNVTTNYRILGEYSACLGEYSHSPDEYLPALTRSSLGLLREGLSHTDVENIVMRYVGLEALKKVTKRSDLVERVVEWSESEGAGIVKELQRWQGAYRMSGPDEKKKMLADVKGILESREPLHPQGAQIALNLVGMSWNQAAEDGGTNTANMSVEPGMRSSYLWLWQIRQPDLRSRWKERIDELVNLS